MGYTHYYTQKKSFTTAQWQKIQDATNAILAYCEKLGIPTRYGFDSKKAASVTAKAIHFNGQDDDGHEDFVIPKALPANTRDGEYFAFCKTARKPYDLAVCLVLLFVCDVAKDVMEVSSDGNNDDWQPAYDSYKKLFRRKAPANVDTLPV